MADWFPGAIRQPLGDAGPYTGGAAKIVWHTTEGDFYPGPGLYNGTNPHFTCDFKRRRVYQHVPLSRASKALMHPSGTGETNHDNCVQIELVGKAAQSGTWTKEDYAFITVLARWIEANHSVARRTIVSFAKPVRLSWSNWHLSGGHCGHVHVPSNDHTDPGTGFRIDLILGDVNAERKRARWNRRLAVVRALSKRSGWSKPRRTLARQLKRLISR